MSLKLVSGAGSEKTGACWMSALHLFTRKDASWTDLAPLACVDPTVRRLCIRLNDLCAGDAEREALIGPHLFAPVGTAGSEELAHARRVECYRFAGRENPDASAAAAAAAAAAYTYAYAAAAAVAAAVAAAAVAAAVAAAHISASAAYPARADARQKRLELRDFILRLCEMGRDEALVEPTCSKACVVERLSR